MKLRLRSLESKETLRIEVPNPCYFQHLREILSQRIPSPSSSFHLSLNRNDELVSSSPEESIQSLGVASGDLIYFTVNPNGFSSESPMVQSLAAVVVRPRPSQESENGETLVLDTQIGETLVSENQEETLHSESIDSETLDLKSRKGETLDSITPKTEETMEYMEIDDGESVHEVGKSFSVPGFLRKVFTEELGDDSGRNHKLLVIAVHAVLLESGFIGFDTSSNTVGNGFLPPGEWPSSAFRMSLCYTLPDIIGHGRIDMVTLKFVSVGKYCNVYGSIANGTGTYWVSIEEDRLAPFLNVVWANCGLVDDTIGKAGFSSTSPEREVFEFWRTVKDRLALPLLIELCEKARLELPPCFMRLPTELKLNILESLPGVDIAKMGCVCSELRYLTSSEDLWKQKHVEQFGRARGSGGGGNWKERFAKSWEIRKRRRIAARLPFWESRRQFFPPWFPGIIGGEYDFWPNLGQVPFPLPGHHGGAYRRSRNTVPHCNLGGLNS